MRAEYVLLACSVVLGFVTILVASAAKLRQRGADWGWGNREGAAPELRGAAFRLDQAASNFQETFPLFAASVLLVGAAGRFSYLSVLGCHLYFWGRLLYVPVYGAGIVYWRTLVWYVSVFGIFFVLGSILV